MAAVPIAAAAYAQYRPVNGAAPWYPNMTVTYASRNQMAADVMTSSLDRQADGAGYK